MDWEWGSSAHVWLPVPHFLVLRILKGLPASPALQAGSMISKRVPVQKQGRLKCTASADCHLLALLGLQGLCNQRPLGAVSGIQALQEVIFLQTWPAALKRRWHNHKVWTP